MIDRSRKTLIDQYDVVIFDCDGVILNTNVEKNRAFESVAVEFGYPRVVSRRFAKWQMANFGISRFRAFEELRAERFGARSDGSRPPELDALVAAYAARSTAIYDAAPETAGARDLLSALTPRPCYVASGGFQEELRATFDARGLCDFFVSVLGSPTPKRDIVRDIVEAERRNGSTAAIVMIGDAVADADAADLWGVDFIFLSRYSTAKPAMLERSAERGYAIVETLADLIV